MHSNNPTLKLDSFWPYQVVVLGDLISRHTLKLVKENTDINLSQWRVLAAIADKAGRTSSQVVAITPMDKGIVSRAVASLLDGNYIHKESDPTDKRRASLYLTPKGRKLYELISQKQTEVIATFQSDNISDPDFNAHLLERITTMLEKI